MNTRRHPRTLQEAFGPHTSRDIDAVSIIDLHAPLWRRVVRWVGASFRRSELEKNPSSPQAISSSTEE